MKTIKVIAMHEILEDITVGALVIILVIVFLLALLALCRIEEALNLRGILFGVLLVLLICWLIGSSTRKKRQS